MRFGCRNCPLRLIPATIERSPGPNGAGNCQGGEGDWTKSVRYKLLRRKDLHFSPPISTGKRCLLSGSIPELWLYVASEPGILGDHGRTMPCWCDVKDNSGL